MTADHVYALAAAITADPRLERIDCWLAQHPPAPITEGGWPGFAQLVANRTSALTRRRRQARFLRCARIAQLHGHRASARRYLASAAATRPVRREQQ